ncbi:cytochrome P450 [Scenedesmus sp. NREL 46B-D3]|nr:cytochrome P450 [Scenedesmus sp. NREL 46B-D3]
MHGLVLKALQAVCLLLGFLVLRSVVFVARLFYARWSYSNSKAFSKIPGPPPAKLVIGHVTDMAGARGVWNIAAMAERYGPVYKLQLLQAVVVVLSDPQTISRVSRKTGHGPYMPKPNEAYKPLEKALKPSLPSVLTATDGPYWKAVRQAAAPCFSMSNLKNVMPLVLELTKRVAARMEAAAAAAGSDVHSSVQPRAAAAGGGALFDVSDAAKRITSDVMGQMLLGEDLQGTQWRPSEYLELFYPVLRAQGQLINNPLHLWQLWRSDVRLQRSCLAKHNDIMNKKMDRIMAQPPPDYTVAAHLLKACVDGRPLSRNQLKTEVAAFMAAGFETTSHAITWTLAALAAHPHVQQQLVDELASLGLAAAAAAGGSGSVDASQLRDIDQADFSRLPLMSAVIKETLRLCPPAPWGGTKLAPQDVQLCGHTVKKGTLVMMPLLALSLASFNYGPDAMLFKPQRWMAGGTAGGAVNGSDAGAGADDAAAEGDQRQADAAAAAAAAVGASKGGSAAAPDPHTFMTGPRDCIGQALAKLELQVVLCTLLARFRFLPGPKLQQELELAAATGRPPVAALHALAGVHVTMQPEDGEMLLLVQPRC